MMTNRGLEIFVVEPIIAHNHVVMHKALSQQHVNDSLVLGRIMAIGLHDQDVDSDRPPVEGLQDKELRTLDIQRPEINVGDAKLREDATERNAGDCQHVCALMVLLELLLELLSHEFYYASHLLSVVEVDITVFVTYGSIDSDVMRPVGDQHRIDPGIWLNEETPPGQSLLKVQSVRDPQAVVPAHLHVKQTRLSVEVVLNGVLVLQLLAVELELP